MDVMFSADWVDVIIVIKINMQKYDIMGLIGEGAYGVVLKCKCN